MINQSASKPATCSVSQPVRMSTRLASQPTHPPFNQPTEQQTNIPIATNHFKRWSCSNSLVFCDNSLQSKSKTCLRPEAIKLYLSYLWTSGGKITAGEIEDDITGVKLDVDGLTVNTVVLKGLEESVGTAGAGVEVSVGKAVDDGAELAVGITVVGAEKDTAEVDVLRGTGK